MIVKIAASFMLATCLVAPALAQSGPRAHRPTLLLHGNYCGPGNNAPLPPIDALDAACARHDACTPDGALPPKACNLRLQRDAELISRDSRQPDDLRALAGLVSAGASIMPFDPDLPSRLAASAPRHHRWVEPAPQHSGFYAAGAVGLDRAGEE